MTARPFQILLVEDNPDDVLLIRRALGINSQTYTVNVVTDGAQALDFLAQQGEHTLAPQPDLVLLDLKLPKTDGRHVLAEIRANPTLKNIPVIVLTSAETEDDSFKTYAGHANSYIKKSIDLSEFTSVIRRMVDFWLSEKSDPGT
jgi:CheY-like chemotaxis protein